MTKNNIFLFKKKFFTFFYSRGKVLFHKVKFNFFEKHMKNKLFQLNLIEMQ